MPQSIDVLCDLRQCERWLLGKQRPYFLKRCEILGMRLIDDPATRLRELTTIRRDNNFRHTIAEHRKTIAISLLSFAKFPFLDMARQLSQEGCVLNLRNRPGDIKPFLKNLVDIPLSVCCLPPALISAQDFEALFAHC